MHVCSKFTRNFICSDGWLETAVVSVGSACSESTEKHRIFHYLNDTKERLLRAVENVDFLLVSFQTDLKLNCVNISHSVELFAIFDFLICFLILWFFLYTCLSFCMGHISIFYKWKKHARITFLPKHDKLYTIAACKRTFKKKTCAPNFPRKIIACKTNGK